MIGVIPVKASVRLPGKHLMTVCGERIIEIILRKVSSVFEPLIYSKIDIPFEYIQDNSDSIIDLVVKLSRQFPEGFALIASAMPFFTEKDLRLLLSEFNGLTTVPKHSDGKLEPLLAIYRGRIQKSPSLHQSILNSAHHTIPAEKFSPYAFFNINTEDDLELANELCKSSS